MKLPRVHFVLIALSAVSLASSTEDIALSPETEVYDCDENETFSQCDANPTCQKTCDNVDSFEMTACMKTKDCIGGCICDDGFVRDEGTGTCVRENSCPRVRH